MSLLAWNERGLNKTTKQKDLRNFLMEQQCGLVCLLEHYKDEEGGRSNKKNVL